MSNYASFMQCAYESVKNSFYVHALAQDSLLSSWYSSCNDIVCKLSSDRDNRFYGGLYLLTFYNDLTILASKADHQVSIDEIVQLLDKVSEEFGRLEDGTWQFLDWLDLYNPYFLEITTNEAKKITYLDGANYICLSNDKISDFIKISKEDDLQFYSCFRMYNIYAVQLLLYSISNITSGEFSFPLKFPVCGSFLNLGRYGFNKYYLFLSDEEVFQWSNNASYLLIGTKSQVSGLFQLSDNLRCP